MPIGQASSWNLDLIERAAYWTGREARAVGIDQTFAPMLDMSRDPRWGRVLEGGGEDVFLSSEVAAARTRGYQRGGVAATPKHFVGYGASEAGREYNSTWIPNSKLWDFHIPPFTAALDAGALTVMAAFNAVNGIPATAHRGLLTGILRERLGFDGLVVSDFNSVGELVQHGVAEDEAEAARLALTAGVDMDMEGYAYERHIPRLVAEGRLDVRIVDEAVRRVLRTKFRMGLFERAPKDIAAIAAELDRPEARADARAIARESLILLTNRDGALPLRPEVRRVAVVGPLATYTDDKPWAGPGYTGAPPVENVVEALARLSPGRVFDTVPALSDRCGEAFADRAEAIRRAGAADLIVAVLGEDCDGIGEAASRTRLGLPGVQEELLRDLVATGKPVVLVLKTGRPLVLAWAADNVAAMLQTFHPGVEGRTAIAEVLLGLVNPSGKTVMSYPRHEGQIPVYYDHLPTGRPLLAPNERFKSRWIDEDNRPLFPFGFGLSFTRFAVSDLDVETPRVARDGTVVARVRIANRGPLAGAEVVQLYARQPVASRSPRAPAHRLREGHARAGRKPDDHLPRARGPAGLPRRRRTPRRRARALPAVRRHLVRRRPHRRIPGDPMSPTSCPPARSPDGSSPSSSPTTARPSARAPSSASTSASTAFPATGTSAGPGPRTRACPGIRAAHRSATNATSPWFRSRTSRTSPRAWALPRCGRNGSAPIWSSRACRA